MTSIDSLIEQISIDAKQQEQIKALFKIAFVGGMAFREGFPQFSPGTESFEVFLKVYLLAASDELLKTYNDHMKEYESGRKTDLV